MQRSAGGRPTYTTLTDKLWSFVKFSDQFNKFEILMMNFTIKYSKTMIFLDIFFCLQEHCFQRFSVFSILYLISLIFLCLYRGKFATLIPAGQGFWHFSIITRFCPNLTWTGKQFTLWPHPNLIICLNWIGLKQSIINWNYKGLITQFQTAAHTPKYAVQ